MENISFLQFLESIDSSNREYVMELNDFLTENQCKCEVKTSKSGYVVSYINLKSKKTLANFVCRKTGVKMRLYPQNINRYQGILSSLPEKMKKEIRKASVCKRLLNPDDCNPKCMMGYDFEMDGECLQKCRYMAFMPSVSQENNPFIKKILENELIMD